MTKNNFRRLLSVLFSFAVEANWCSANPCENVKPFPQTGSSIGILTPHEAQILLEKAEERVKPLIAIGLFAGLRPSELMRVNAASIRLESGLIQVDVTKTKGCARRFVRLRPNLHAWLARYPLGDLSADEFRNRLEMARVNAGIKSWPHNALRHSFCSYALAHERNLNELMLEMGHTNAQTLFAHYRELVTPADAAEYWDISPS